MRNIKNKSDQTKGLRGLWGHSLQTKGLRGLWETLPTDKGAQRVLGSTPYRQRGSEGSGRHSLAPDEPSYSKPAQRLWAECWD